MLTRDRQTVSLSSAAALAACLLLSLPAAPAAHDIPNDVPIKMFVRPEGQQLRLLVRVPLVAMRDMDYPKRAFGRAGFFSTSPRPTPRCATPPRCG